MPLIAVVTPLFPIQEELYRGKPIYKTVLALQKYADIKVFCPMAVYPPMVVPRYRYHRAEASFQPPGIEAEYFEYSVVPLLTRPFNGRRCAAALEPRLNAVPYDMVLSYWVYPDGYASVRLAHQRGKPVIVGARGSDLRRIEDPLTRALTSRTVREADRILTVSEELRQWAITMGGRPEHVRSIRNGCDHAVFRYVPLAEARSQLGIPMEHQVILFVGWMVPAKGSTVLLQAFQILAQENPNARLMFIGEGHTADIQALARSHGTEDRVRLVGACAPPEVSRWMAAADVLCLPSQSEGCPNVLLEAAAVGCPVVATAVGGIPEVVSPDLGILVSEVSPEAVAKALRDLLGRSWNREEISRSSTRGWDKVAEETYEVCREVMHKPLRHARPAAPAIHTAKKRLKITVVTPYFPISEEPYRGHSAFQTLRCMKKYADIHVLCPISVYPRTKLLHPSGYRYKRPDLNYRPADLNATYFTYPVLPVVTRPFNGMTCARYLKPYLEASRPDLILNYWIYPEGYAALNLGRQAGIPVVLGSIGSDLLRPGDRLSFWLTRSAIRNADGLIAVSEDLRHHAIAMGVAPDRVATVLNGCDHTLFYPRDRQAVRRELGIPADAQLLLYVGWISPTKGLQELVDALAAMAKSRPQLRLAVIGEGSYDRELIQQSAAAGIKDRILFLGPQTSAGVAQWMGACDVFCLPSHSEGCPNVIVESLASGRPVVSTTVGGIPELIDTNCGILVPPRDTTALTSALQAAFNRTWSTGEIAAQFGRSWESAAEETYDFCLRVAETRG